MDCYQRIEANGAVGRRPTLEVAAPFTDKREIIVFPGIDGMKNWPNGGPRALSGLLKLIRGAVPALGQRDVRISGLMYSFESHKDADAMQEEPRKFVRSQLLPRLGLDGPHHPSISVLQAAMNRLTFVTHSYGGKFAQQVAEALKEELTNKRYDPRDISKVLASGVVIATAGHTAVDVSPQFTTLFFRAVNDPVPIHGPTWLGKPVEVIREQTGYLGPTEFNIRTLKQGLLVTAELNDHLEAVDPEDGEIDVWQQVPNAKAAETPEEKERQRINDIRHSPRSHWLPHIPDEGEHDTSLYVTLKNQALSNAIRRPLNKISQAGNLLFDHCQDTQALRYRTPGAIAPNR